jgi:hypothetical protein
LDRIGWVLGRRDGSCGCGILRGDRCGFIGRRRCSGIGIGRIAGWLDRGLLPRLVLALVDERKLVFFALVGVG